MASFIGRKTELSSLEELYGKGGFQMTVLYGRRRVGKSTLLTQFVKGKQAVFYTAIRSSAQRNLELLSRTYTLARGVRPATTQVTCV